MNKFVKCKCGKLVVKGHHCPKCKIVPVEFDYQRCNPIMWIYKETQETVPGIGPHLRIVACRVMKRNSDGSYTANIEDLQPDRYLCEVSSEPGTLRDLDKREGNYGC